MAVKSAERVLKIFELLEQQPEGLTNKEISEVLKYAPSSTLMLLQTMEENGYLSVDVQKRYSLGGRLVSLGATVASRFDIGKMAGIYLKRLMQNVEETSFLAVLSDNEIFYVAKEQSERSMATNAQIGSRKPVYCTGLGKAFLSFLPADKSRDIIRNIEFQAYTEKTVKNCTELMEQIREFRTLGYAIDDQEIEEGLWCLAVPVYDGYGTMVAAMSVSGPKERMLKKKDLVIQEVVSAGRDFSKELGFRKEK